MRRSGGDSECWKEIWMSPIGLFGPRANAKQLSRNGNPVNITQRMFPSHRSTPERHIDRQARGTHGLSNEDVLAVLAPLMKPATNRRSLPHGHHGRPDAVPATQT